VHFFLESPGIIAGRCTLRLIVFLSILVVPHFLLPPVCCFQFLYSWRHSSISRIELSQWFASPLLSPSCYYMPLTIPSVILSLLPFAACHWTTCHPHHFSYVLSFTPLGVPTSRITAYVHRPWSPYSSRE